MNTESTCISFDHFVNEIHRLMMEIYSGYECEFQIQQMRADDDGMAPQYEDQQAPDSQAIQ